LGIRQNEVKTMSFIKGVSLIRIDVPTGHGIDAEREYPRPDRLRSYFVQMAAMRSCPATL
jgi:hypothetical protein